MKSRFVSLQKRLVGLLCFLGCHSVRIFGLSVESMAPTSADLHPLLVVSPSKALRGLFTKMRDVGTSSEDFVKFSKRAMRLVVEDALAEFPVNEVTIQTPCGPCDGVQSSVLGSAGLNLCAVSILRSGDCLLETVRDVEPACRVGKILIQRDETHPDKIAKLFYSKLPKTIADENSYVLLCDPMLGTGGSALAALNVLTQDHSVDPSKIIFCNMICCPEGLRALAAAYPQVKIITAFVDQCLNEEKFIVPGLGDYGDRFFNTPDS